MTTEISVMYGSEKVNEYIVFSRSGLARNPEPGTHWHPSHQQTQYVEPMLGQRRRRWRQHWLNVFASCKLHNKMSILELQFISNYSLEHNICFMLGQHFKRLANIKPAVWQQSPHFKLLIYISPALNQNAANISHVPGKRSY